MPTSTTIHGDCVEQMKLMDDNSVDSVVCDPPYGLSFMGKEWDSFTDAQAMGEWSRRWAVEAFRVLKPGGHIIAFAGSRTYHRMAQGIEDAGFEIRDQIMWMYGSGFPKSLNVSKAIDKRGGVVADFEPFRDAVIHAMKETGVTRKALTKALGNDMLSHYITKGSQPAVPKLEDYLVIRESLELGEEWDHLFLPEAEREVVGKGTSGIAAAFGEENLGSVEGLEAPDYDVTISETDMAKKWEGWGTALKPAHEPCVLGRKPFPTSVVENVLKHGTGAINIDGSRVATDDVMTFERKGAMWTSEENQWREFKEDTSTFEQHENGRFPTNVLVSHHEECTAEECDNDCPRQTLDRQSGHVAGSGKVKVSTGGANRAASWEADGGMLAAGKENTGVRDFGDGGGASRYFHAPKLDTEFNSENNPAVLGRKPLIGTVAENVLEHETGGINIDGARVGETMREVQAGTGERVSGNGSMNGWNTKREVVGQVKGRYPTNVIVSHHPECKPTGEYGVAIKGGSGTGGSTTPDSVFESSGFKPNNEVEKVKASEERVEIYNCHDKCPRHLLDNVADGSSRFFHAAELDARSGEWGPDFEGADRFMYVPKPSKAERHVGGRTNIHPTVKPVDIMRYLCRLVTPKGGTVLDPFMGSGTTGVAAILEGFNFIGIELSEEFHDLAEYRIKELTLGRPRNMGEWFS